MPEIEVIAHLLCDVGNLSLEIHVSTVEKILNNIAHLACTSAAFTSAIHEVLET